MQNVQYAPPPQQAVPQAPPQPPPPPQQGDSLAQLPTDTTSPTHNELEIVDTLFKKHSGEMNSIFEESKSSIIAGLLFIAFSLSQTDDLIRKFLPSVASSPYMLLAFKAAAFVALLWIINHYYLSRK